MRQLPEPCNPTACATLTYSQEQLNTGAAALSDIGLFTSVSGFMISLGQVINFMMSLHIPRMKSCDNQAPVTQNKHNSSKRWLLTCRISQCIVVENNRILHYDFVGSDREKEKVGTYCNLMGTLTCQL